MLLMKASSFNIPKNVKIAHVPSDLCVVHKYNQLMKDFPLNELLSATDLDKIRESLILIFGHISRKLRLSPYPIRRALPLVEAISRDFNDQLLRILTSQRLPYTPHNTFERLLLQTLNIFQTWDERMKEFTIVAREVTKIGMNDLFLSRLLLRILSYKRGRDI